ncbi:MAG: hypothetical protein M3R67_09930 [Acidobacteriota bacterium]|nr:hypothetical protein [Acidobacteriota bacterium]
MSKFIVFVMVIMCAGVTVSAQTQNDVKHYFEGRQMMDSRGPAPQAGIEALRKYPDLSDVEDERSISVPRQISYEYAAPGSRKIGVVRVGSPTTYLKRGLTTKDVFQVLGKPAGISKRVEDGMVVTTFEFRRGGERVLVAEFVHDKLVRSRIETREQIAQRNR